MSIFDDTGRSPSITEGPRSLHLFTDRYHLIRVFTRALHEDDALGKIFFFRGGGGNGKSLLIRFLQQYACKRFFNWDEVANQPDAEFVDRLRQDDPSFHTTFNPLPVAHIDFHATPREFEQPTVDYDALLMIRRQLAAFRAEGFTRLRFPVYDFAAVWYLHQTGRLTEERLSSLFPNEEIGLVIALAQLFKEIPGSGIAPAVFGLFDQHLGQWWTLFKHRRQVDPTVIEEIQAMDSERDLIPEMPRLFAKDLNAALTAPGAPQRIILLADGHEVFSGPDGDSRMELDRDRWLRNLLGNLDLSAGIVPIITSRQEPRWADRSQDAIPTQYLDSHSVDHFSDADAGIYLEKAGVDDFDLRARLCDYARIASDEIHPLYAGLGADIVLQAIQQGRRMTVEDFPDKLPDAQSKRQILVDCLLREARSDVGYAVRSLAAARAFDRELFERLSSWERTRYSATDAAFDTLTQFSFVWEAQSQEGGEYSIHTLLRRIFREREDERTREADAVLEAIYRERTEAGDTLALAEVAYHAYQLEPERGLNVWADAFEEARKLSQYALCEALRTVSAEIKIEEPGWRARIAREEGEYLLARSRYAEAKEVLKASVSASDEAIRHAPDAPNIYSNKGVALRALGNLLASQSRYEEAEEAYTNAIAAFDAEIDHTPDEPLVHSNRGNALSALGGLLANLSRYDEAEKAHRDAVEALEEAIRRAPGDPMVYNNKGNALSALAALLATLSRNEEAERLYDDAVADVGEAISRASDDPRYHDNKGSVLQSLGDLLSSLSRYEDAESLYNDAVVAFDEAISLAPDGPGHHSKANALRARGDLLALLSRYDEADAVLARAIAAVEEAISRAPNNVHAYRTKSIALQSYAALLAILSRPDDAEVAYTDAVAVLDDAIRLAPGFTNAYISKGIVLQRYGLFLVNLSRTEDAEKLLDNSIATFDEALNRSPDNIHAYFNKGDALRARGDVLALLYRHEEAEDALILAIVAIDEAISRAPNYVHAYNNKGVAQRSLGGLLVNLSRQEEAEREFRDAVATLDETLALASDDIYAHVNKGDTLQSLGGLLGDLYRYKEAEKVYGEAVAVLGEAINLAPDFTYAHFKKGNALATRGDMLASISRFEDAQRAFSDAVAAYDEELNRVPDDVGVHLMKALALVNQGRLMQILDSQKHVVRALLEEAQSHTEHILSLVPDDTDAASLLAQIRGLLDSL